MLSKIFFGLSLTLVITNAQARLLPSSINRNIEDYRTGDEWGKKFVTPTEIASGSAVYKRATAATAKVRTATGFYLGKFNGTHILATNHHVCPQEASCLNKDANFVVLNKKFRMKKFFFSLTEIDLALYELEVPAKDEADLMKVGKNFAFHKDIKHGQEFLTVGFGVAGNPSQEMVANEDSDCKAFSGTGEYRFLADPDDFNPADYQTWSFSHGCDISHGDSGSAVVDRHTGEVVGILWTGRIPKSPVVQNSAYLVRLLANPTEEVWKELSYAAPAAKIGEVLKRLSNDMSVDLKTREMYKAMLK